MARRGENIHKRKDGRWEGRYIKGYDMNGKAKYGSVYSKTYTDVKRKLLTKKKELLKTCFDKNDEDTNFNNVLNLWLNNNRLSIKDQTYDKYKRLIDAHIAPDIGMIKIKKINTFLVNRYLYEKIENGRLDGCGGLSISYVKTISFIIKSALKFAANEGFYNVTLGNIVLPHKEKTVPNVLSTNEQKILEKYIKEDTNNKKIGVLISLYTGLRIGEVCALRWQDINFDEKTIHVQHTLSRITQSNSNFPNQKTKLEIRSVKSSSSNRIIPIPDSLFNILAKRRSISDEFVIKGEKYPFLDPRSYQYMFNKCLKKCGIRDTNYHTLRHTFATRCIESGMDIKTLSEILGHSNVNITLNIYVHSSMELKRKQIETMAIYCGH